MMIETGWPRRADKASTTDPIIGRRLLEPARGCLALQDSPRETLANLSTTGIYAASRINQLRKSSSTASQTPERNLASSS